MLPNDSRAAIWLADELLEAHLDTVRLLQLSPTEAELARHLEEVQALYRHGRAFLARVSPATVRDE